MKKNVPSTVIKRLPRYHRYLGELLNSGVKRISSASLSEKMGVTASQIRQDLNNFGGFGQQGYGYNVEILFGEISAILGASENYTAIMVGVGNLGKAIATNINFKKRGVVLTALFDTNPEKIGTQIGEFEISDMKDIDAYVKKNKPDIAILTLPKTEASQVLERLNNLGIKGFWNFSNMEIKKIGNYEIENVHIGDSLMTLCYSLKQKYTEIV